MTYFFLFFKRDDILVDVIIFAKDKAENQKKFCKRKMEENMEKNKIKKIALIFNILQVIALAVFEVVLLRLVSYKNKLVLDYVPAKYFIILEVVLVAITIIPFLIRKGKKTSIISMVISILMKTLVEVLNIVTKLPVIHTFNMAGGALIGFAQAILIIWLLCMVVTIFSSTSWGQTVCKAIADNGVLSMIYDNNLIQNIVNSLF